MHLPGMYPAERLKPERPPSHAKNYRLTLVTTFVCQVSQSNLCQSEPAYPPELIARARGRRRPPASTNTSTWTFSRQLFKAAGYLQRPPANVGDRLSEAISHKRIHCEDIENFMKFEGSCLNAAFHLILGQWPVWAAWGFGRQSGW